MCICNTEHETCTVAHYLLRCPRYAALRHNLHSSAAQVFGDNWYLLSDLLRVSILLSGSTRLNISENQNIFKSAQYYIKQTERFS